MKEVSKYLVYLIATIGLAGCKKRKSHAIQNLEGEQEAELETNSSDVSEGLSEELSDESSSSDSKEEQKTTHYYYAFNSYKLSQEDVEKIKTQYAYLKDNNAKIVIYGNCDQIGSKAYNMGLASSRGVFVKNILILLGIDVSRITVVSLGQTILVEGDSKEAYAKNRVAIIEIDGKVGGEQFNHSSSKAEVKKADDSKVKKAVEADNSEDEDDEDEDN